jgi:drug/metabolite transporter (DMT)-like permease
MYVGLTLTYASVFQMLRGSVVIFTGILSVLFLKRKLAPYRWVGMALVLVGTAAVGTSSFVCKDDSSTGARNPTVGNILIIVAQVVVAVQVVVEEKFISGYNIPALQVVGWEGLWGFSILSCVLTGMYFLPQPAFLQAPGAPHTRFEDSGDAFCQLGNSWQLGLAIGGNILSIAFFNYFGISVTKHMNAATRMVLDSVRTVVIWAFSMAVAWQKFCYVQVIGFIVLLAGTVVYNGILKIPGMKYEEETEHDSDEDEVLARRTLLDLEDPTLTPGSASIGMESPMFPSLDALRSPAMGKATAVHGR